METSPLICNQWTGFHLIEISVMKKLDMGFNLGFCPQNCLSNNEIAIIRHCTMAFLRLKNIRKG